MLFTNQCELSPLGIGDTAWVYASLRINPGVTAGMADDSLLRTILAALTAQIDTADLADWNSPDWPVIEQALRQTLPELFPWLWANPTLKLHDGSNWYALQAGRFEIVAHGNALHADSVTQVRRALLSSLFRGSGQLRDADALDLPGADTADLSTTEFELAALYADAARAPAPLPHEALSLVWIVRLDRAWLRTLGSMIFVSAASRDAVIPTAAPTLDDVDRCHFDYDGAGSRSRADLVGLARDALLRDVLQLPPHAFVDPFVSLWLSKPAQAEFGGAFLAHDWQSQLPRLVEAAVEPLARCREALQLAVERGDRTVLTRRDLIALLACLRESVGAGIALDSTGRLAPGYHVPLAADLLRLLPLPAEREEAREPDLAPYLDDPARVPDQANPGLVARVRLLRAIAAYEASLRSAGRDWVTWYDFLREHVPALAALMPPTSSDWIATSTSLTAVEALAEVGTLLDAALETETRIAILWAEWQRAAAAIPVTDPARARVLEFLERALRGRDEAWRVLDLPTLARRDIADDPVHGRGAVPRAVRAATGAGFFERLKQVVVDQVEARFAAVPLRWPAAERPAVLPLADIAGALVKHQIQPLLLPVATRAPDAAPAPICLQIDSLNDDGDQNSEVDVNEQLRGYAAFLRARSPSRDGDWRLPQAGKVFLTEWFDPDKPLLNADGNVLTALHPRRADCSGGMRQVVVRHDNEPWLPTTEAIKPQSALAVVLARGDLQIGTFGTRLPPAAFGLTYEAVAFAQNAGGGLPGRVGASGAPHRLAPDAALAQDLGGNGFAAPRHVLRYTRTVGVGELRLRAALPVSDGGTRHQALAEIVPDFTGPFAVPDNYPLAHREWAQADGDDVPPAVVLLSDAGFPAPPEIPDVWSSATLELRRPTCSHAVWDRWTGRDQFDETAPGAPPNGLWARWRRRVHAADGLRAELLTQFAALSPSEREAQLSALGLPADALQERLEDPAIDGLRLRFTPLRSRGRAADPIDVMLPWGDLPGAHEPVAGELTVAALLAELRRTESPAWQLLVRVTDTPAPIGFVLDAAKRRVTLQLRPGEFGTLTIGAACGVAEFGADGRFDADRFADLDTARDDAGREYRVFAPRAVQLEVASGHLVDGAALYEALSTRVGTDGSVALRLTRPAFVPGDADDARLRWDHLGSVTARWQAWRPSGKPVADFPDPRQPLDTLPVPVRGQQHRDPRQHAVLWDAEGFAEREESAGRVLERKRILLTATESELALLPPQAASPGARYVRFGAEASSRYAELYRSALQKDVLPVVVARRSQVPNDGLVAETLWRRALRPGRWQQPVPVPLVKLVVPLTDAFDGDGHAADLLVLLNEEWHLVGGLAETLEASVDVVDRDYGKNVRLTRPEYGPDPIVSGAAADRTLPHLPVTGPLGLTFDPDTSEALFVATAYVVHTDAALPPFGMAKLALRRVLDPTLMEGHVEHTVASGSVPALDRDALAEVGEGCLTVEALVPPAHDATEPWQLLADGTTVMLQLCYDFDADAWSVDPAGAASVVVRPLRVAANQRFRPAAVRWLVKRLRDYEPAGDSDSPERPALWDHAVYFRGGDRDGWARVAGWRLERADAQAPALEIRRPAAPPLGAGVAVAQCAPRASAYTEAQWVQVLARTDRLAIAGKPWCVHADDDRPAPIEVVHLTVDGDTLRPSADQALRLHWVSRPALAAHGATDGQGLCHRLLLMRRLLGASGGESQGFVGFYDYDGRRFVRCDGGAGPLGDADTLRGYVVLVQVDPRIARRPDALTRIGALWSLLSPGSVPEFERDIGGRILGVSPAIHGTR